VWEVISRRWNYPGAITAVAATEIFYNGDMGRGSGGGGGAGGSRRRGRHRPGEAGISLVEVILATAVLIVVFVPVSRLLAGGVSDVGSSAHQGTADSVAAGVIAQEQSAALSDRSGPPLDTSTPPEPFYPQVAARAWVSPALETQKVGGVTYHVYGVGGWCLARETTGSPGQWTDAPSSMTAAHYPSSNPAEYFVAVEVTWGAMSATPDGALSATNPLAVTDYGALTARPTWAVPSVAALVAEGSLNICPIDPTDGVA